MSYSSIYFTFAVAAILYGKSWSQINGDYTGYCANHPTEEIACYGERDLIICFSIGPDRLGALLVTCPQGSFCSAVNAGCTWIPPSTPTTPAPASTGSTVSTTQLICKTGDMKSYPGECRKYYYCRSNAWIESSCPANSEYNDLQESCVFSATC